MLLENLFRKKPKNTNLEKLIKQNLSKSDLVGKIALNIIADQVRRFHELGADNSAYYLIKNGPSLVLLYGLKNFNNFVDFSYELAKHDDELSMVVLEKYDFDNRVLNDSNKKALIELNSIDNSLAKLYFDRKNKPIHLKDDLTIEEIVNITKEFNKYGLHFAESYLLLLSYYIESKLDPLDVGYNALELFDNPKIKNNIDSLKYVVLNFIRNAPHWYKIGMDKLYNVIDLLDLFFDINDESFKVYVNGIVNDVRLFYELDKNANYFDVRDVLREISDGLKKLEGYRKLQFQWLMDYPVIQKNVVRVDDYLDLLKGVADKKGEELALELARVLREPNENIKKSLGFYV